MKEEKKIPDIPQSECILRSKFQIESALRRMKHHVPQLEGISIRNSVGISKLMLHMDF